jgi:hypothetical protein
LRLVFLHICGTNFRIILFFGICSENRCECQPPYSGVACGVECSGRGHDNGHGECVCTEAGSIGTNCGIPCTGHGSLRDDRCICDDGWNVSPNAANHAHEAISCYILSKPLQPPYCMPRCEAMCVNGACDGEECVCRDDWGGLWCHQKGKDAQNLVSFFPLFNSVISTQVVEPRPLTLEKWKYAQVRWLFASSVICFAPAIIVGCKLIQSTCLRTLDVLKSNQLGFWT